MIFDAVHSESESKVAQSCPTLCDPMDCSPPGSSVHGILQQEYWSGLPFPSPGDLPNPGIKPRSPALQADTLPSEPPGNTTIQKHQFFSSAFFIVQLSHPLASLVAQMVKYLPAMWETRVQPLGQEDPLEKGTATHSRILAWRIPWTEEPGGLQLKGVAESDTTEQVRMQCSTKI